MAMLFKNQASVSSLEIQIHSCTMFVPRDADQSLEISHWSWYSCCGSFFCYDTEASVGSVTHLLGQADKRTTGRKCVQNM